MIRILKLAIAIVAVILSASTANAQTLTKFGPGDSLSVSWPASAVSPDTLDAPDGYRVKSFAPTATGVVLKSWTTDAATRTLTIDAASMPSGVFNLSVVAFNVAGEAGASNVIGPFGKAAIPQAVAGVAATVVRGEQ